MNLAAIHRAARQALASMERWANYSDRLHDRALAMAAIASKADTEYALVAAKQAQWLQARADWCLSRVAHHEGIYLARIWQWREAKAFLSVDDETIWTLYEIDALREAEAETWLEYERADARDADAFHRAQDAHNAAVAALDAAQSQYRALSKAA